MKKVHLIIRNIQITNLWDIKYFLFVLIFYGSLGTCMYICIINQTVNSVYSCHTYIWHHCVTHTHLQWHRFSCQWRQRCMKYIICISYALKPQQLLVPLDGEEVAQLTKRIILDVEFIIRETFQYVTSRFTFNVR